MKICNKKSICKSCMTGMHSLGIDPTSQCPHIVCWQDNECPFYTPVEKPSFWKRLFNVNR